MHGHMHVHAHTCMCMHMCGCVWCGQLAMIDLPHHTVGNELTIEMEGDCETRRGQVTLHICIHMFAHPSVHMSEHMSAHMCIDTRKATVRLVAGHITYR